MLLAKINPTHQAGFNLIELMVVLFVAGILLGIGVPSMGNLISNNRIATASNDIAVSVHMARTEAVKRQANVTICPSTTWGNAAPTCDLNGELDAGWIVFVDSVPPAAPNLAVDGAEVLYAHGPLHPDINLTVADTGGVLGGPKFIAFGSSGFPLANVGGNSGIFNLQLCDHRGNTDIGGGIAAGRWLQLGRTGRPSLHRKQGAVQSGNNPTGGC